jgi:hypothetical protein
MGVATAVRRRLVLAAVRVVQWSMDLDVTFIMFEVLCTSGEYLYNRSDPFYKKKTQYSTPSFLNRRAYNFWLKLNADLQTVRNRPVGTVRTQFAIQCNTPSVCVSV